jgi:hypothetical protein
MQTSTTLDDLVDRLDIIDTCNAMAWHADRRDWSAVLAVLAEDVDLDYTSLNGGQPATLPKGDVVAAWRSLFERLTVTQHLLSSHLVTVNGDLATCTANVCAVHVGAVEFGDSQWVLGGHYRFELALVGGRWLITGLSMTATWASGNRAVMAPAAR